MGRDAFIVDRIRAAMQAHGLDGVVAVSKENIAYQLGYTIPSQALGVRDRQFAVVTNAAGESAVLLSSNELREADARSAVRDLRTYDEFTEDPMATLAGMLADLGLAAGRVGVEMDALPASRWESLKTHHAGELVPGSEVFRESRRVKSPAELDRLRTVTSIADQAQASAYDRVREGTTEREVYRLIADAALAHGADEVLMVQVAVAERTSMSNPIPTDRALARGDVVKVDNFFSTGGYLCDTGRALFVGEISDEQRHVWDRVQDVRSRLHAAIRPGVRTSELWSLFQDGFAEHDLTPAIRFLGHGLGLSLHEEPYIAGHTDIALEADMVLAIEPICQVGDIKYFLEDNLRVTETGHELLTAHWGSEPTVVGV